MAKIKGLHLLMKILSNVIQQVTNCEAVTFANQADNSPKYPYFAISVITDNHEEFSDYWVENRRYSIILQIDCHSNDLYEAHDLVANVHQALNNREYRRIFAQANIVPQTVDDIADGTVLQGTNYVQDFHFDATFMLSDDEFEESKLNFTISPNTTIHSTSTNDINSTSTVENRKESANG